MTNLLITGARGFIGSHLLPLIDQNRFTIHATSSGRPIESSIKIFHQVDLHDPGTTNALIESIKPSVLLHLAWYTEHGKYWGSQENLRWVETTLRLLREFKMAGGRRVIIIGTCAEYQFSDAPCNEETTPRYPKSLYGVCKNSLYEIIHAYSSEYDLALTWGRLFFPYGPGEPSTKLVTATIRSLLAQQEAKCTHGNQIRDFIYVRDVASAINALLEHEIPGAVNLGSGVDLSIKTVCETIGDQLGRRDLVRLGAIPSPLDDPARISADITKLQVATAWRPVYSLEEGIADTIRSLQSHIA